MKISVALLLAVLLPLTGCLSNTPPAMLETGTVLKSSDGLSQITLPQGWKEDKELHAGADLEASDRIGEKYIIVLSESKDDFQEMTLEKHSETTRGSLLSSLSEPQVTGPSLLTVNGYPAMQYEIRGGIQNMNIVYLHTTVETQKNFHQILGWTLKSRFEKNQAELRHMINSFKEVDPAQKK